MFCIQTYSRKQFDLLNPRAEDICIEDIAHALSNLCRFTGHTSEFYSVAQHSVIMGDQALNRRDRILMLLHDAHEAYLGDISGPLTIALEYLGADLPKLKKRYDRVIFEAFGYGTPTNKEYEHIRFMDNRMLLTERRDLMGGEAFDWCVQGVPSPYTIHPWLPRKAKAIFLDEWNTVD